MLTVFLGISMVYALGYFFKPEDLGSRPFGAILVQGHLFVFAYSGGEFVQASVVVTGSETPMISSINGTPVSAITRNGTTSTDLQNPLRFLVLPGTYFVSGTYGSTSVENVTVGITDDGQYREVVLNFGSSSPPRLGHVIVCAWYSSAGSGSYVEASVVITGPESVSGVTRASYPEPAVFTMEPGAYSITGTYGSAPPQSATVDVKAGEFAKVVLYFGGEPPF